MCAPCAAASASSAPTGTNVLAKTLSGMTGFGAGTRTGDYGEIRVEARSVNGKGLDLRLRLPVGLDSLDAPLREAARKRFARGSLTLTVTHTRAEEAASVRIDEARLALYAQAATDLATRFSLTPATAGELLALKGAIVSEEAGPDEAQSAALLAAAQDASVEALDALHTARQGEGAALLPVLTAHLDEIESLRASAADNAAATPEAIRDRIKAKFDALLPSGLDPDRLDAEAAALAVKADIREELDRLTAHITDARELLAAGSPCGRKLDFLSQEFNREVNTLCSKASDTELTRTGLAMKAVVDRLREQVQNLE